MFRAVNTTLAAGREERKRENVQDLSDTADGPDLSLLHKLVLDPAAIVQGQLSEPRAVED